MGRFLAVKLLTVYRTREAARLRAEISDAHVASTKHGVTAGTHTSFQAARGGSSTFNEVDTFALTKNDQLSAPSINQPFLEHPFVNSGSGTLDSRVRPSSALGLPLDRREADTKPLRQETGLEADVGKMEENKKDRKTKKNKKQPSKSPQAPKNGSDPDATKAPATFRTPIARSILLLQCSRNRSPQCIPSIPRTQMWVCQSGSSNKSAYARGYGR